METKSIYDNFIKTVHIPHGYTWPNIKLVQEPKYTTHTTATLPTAITYLSFPCRSHSKTSFRWGGPASSSQRASACSTASIYNGWSSVGSRYVGEPSPRPSIILIWNSGICRHTSSRLTYFLNLFIHQHLGPNYKYFA